MARTIDQPTAAIRPNTVRAELDTDGPGSFDRPEQRGEGGRLGNAERRENLNAVRDEPDSDRDAADSNRDGQNRRDGDTDERPRRDHSQVLSPGVDAFAPVFEAWKQVFRSWSELTDTMVKAQRDAFAGMIGAVDTAAKELASSKAHHTVDAGPIEHDRR